VIVGLEFTEAIMRIMLVSLFVLAATATVLLAQEEVVFKNYNLKHISLKNPEVRQKVEMEIRKVVSANGQFNIDERTNQIFVRDSQENQNKVARLIAKLDVGKKEDKSVVTVTVRVANIEASTAREALEEAMKEDAKLATLKISHSDETATVMLTGTAAQLEKARAIIDSLEEKFRSEVETKVYKISNRSAKSLADIVKLHLAGKPGTGVAVDEVTNSLIVRETRANQAKVKEVVSKFDTELKTLFLKFRVIYASRESRGIDESVKDVQEDLKKKGFDFPRYKAQESPSVRVQQGHGAEFNDSGSGLSVSLARCDYDSKTKRIRIEGLKVSLKVERGEEKPSILTISTTIKVTAGKPTIIGAQTSKNAKDALIVVVEATVEK
jgi:hypothetical protein